MTQEAVTRSYEIYCPVCQEWILVEVFDEDRQVAYHNGNEHTDDDLEALDNGIQ